MHATDTVPRPKVLVIDDNKGILFCLSQALTLKGYDVETSETFEGVEAVQKIAPNVLFLDISLVGQDGREVSRELKSDARTLCIPIVILTAYPNASDLVKEAGADGFLSKPFDLADLWNITEKHCTALQKPRIIDPEVRRGGFPAREGGGDQYF